MDTSWNAQPLNEPHPVDIDAWIADRDEGRFWQPLGDYKDTTFTQPKSCPECQQTARFYQNDYVCRGCRDGMA